MNLVNLFSQLEDIPFRRRFTTYTAKKPDPFNIPGDQDKH
jgi:hypothetical protein